MLERLPITTLDALLLRFAALADDAEPDRHVRGTVLAVAQDWLIRIPEGPRRDEALDLLGDAAEMAVKALYPADACS